MDKSLELEYFKEIFGLIRFIEKQKLKTRDDIQIHQVSDNPFRALIFNPEDSRMLIVNFVGVKILEMCDGKYCLGEIVKKIREQLSLNLDNKELLLDIIKFIRKCQYYRILETVI
ncbi:hypothetical protein TheetDRAFT_2306 [Thermoanaerobacter ethanolicus JW 200]|uniref:Coenzyme PQQ synthesis protein D (PqqD) n=1 Tax=Caldanaerobacter subterraneus subsp. yonseiensis KB-1 TaxID=1388761 RepID=U5CP23_CALSX|nr:PqqD family protein [Caldanaerobacter subterraneus]EGD50874.1 hypothetical protein TheetDRAFT_2306 [Thermoanaerobacter ethanolicus JW 200]ERM90701.1 hypothetical protein O163_14540 [Caldanaerobacter subterraneus subsp. yonseiensis KB-1]MBE3579929.1 PqqD family protein [Caldanaerobacter subterraneus]